MGLFFQITAPSISDARCKDTLLSAIERLLASLRDLKNTWVPFVNNPEYRQLGNQLNHDMKSAQMVLSKLQDACQEDAGKQ